MNDTDFKERAAYIRKQTEIYLQNARDLLKKEQIEQGKGRAFEGVSANLVQACLNHACLSSTNPEYLQRSEANLWVLMKYVNTAEMFPEFLRDEINRQEPNRKSNAIYALQRVRKYRGQNEI